LKNYSFLSQVITKNTGTFGKGKKVLLLLIGSHIESLKRFSALFNSGLEKWFLNWTCYAGNRIPISDFIHSYLSINPCLTTILNALKNVCRQKKIRI